MSLKKVFVRGLWEESPIFRQILGMCPTLAVTNTAINGMSMGLATLFVLVGSSIVVSTFRKLFPGQIRLASYILIIATFVTMADLFMAGSFPAISKALGPYVPLIVVNCLILGRAEAFSSKNPVAKSMADALGMGLGFTWALILLGVIRELLGSGTFFGLTVLGKWFQPWLIMVLPPGAFLTLGLLIGIMNHFFGQKQEARHQHR